MSDTGAARARPNPPLDLPGQAASPPLISIVVVIRNQVDQIAGLMECLLGQDYPNFEILVVDGGSGDGTPEAVAKFAANARGVKVRILPNPKISQGPGFNVGIQAAGGSFIQRIDGAHCRLPSHYINHCLARLIALRQVDPGVVAAGGHRETVAGAETAWARAIAAAHRSRFGLGNASYRHASHAGPVRTLGTFLIDRRALLELGGYDENLGRSEDNDLNDRIGRRGWKIYLLPEIHYEFQSRVSPSSLAQQIYGNGLWVAYAALTTGRKLFEPRHFAPLAFALVLSGLALGGLLNRTSLLLAAALFALYLAAGLASALVVCRRRTAAPLRVFGVFALMHACHAAGTMRGIYHGLRGRNPAGARP